MAKSHRITKTNLGEWRKLLRDVEKDIMPVDLIDDLTIKLISGDEYYIDVSLLLLDMSPKEVEYIINEEITLHEKNIVDVDYRINITRLKNIVIPLTNKLLMELN